MTRTNGWGRWIGAGAVVAGLVAAGVGTTAAVASAKTSPKAKVQLLRVSDFPTGWKATPTTTASTTTGTNEFAAIAACEGLTGSTIDTTVPDAQASFSHKKTAQFAFETVGVFPSVGSSKQVYALFSAPKAPTCVGQALAKAVAAGTTTGNITSSDITVSKLPVPRIGAASTALQLAIPLTVEGTQLTMNADFVVIRKAKSIAIVAPVGLSATTPTSFAVSLGKKAAARLH
ncbi:MAG TPA: hypothetical protein VHW47_06760 [Acidimicrobiales bacterium]|jgi:hypothetical protein|nr:hypothetical protein [Acidimicrobiales bacterium]